MAKKYIQRFRCDETFLICQSEFISDSNFIYYRGQLVVVSVIVLECHCEERGNLITIIFSCICGHGLKILAIETGIETQHIRAIWAQA